MVDLLLATFLPEIPPAKEKSRTKSAGPPQRVSNLHWLMVGGTGRPPSSYAALMRLAGERKEVGTAKTTWKTARKAAKKKAATAKEDIDSEFASNWGRQPKSRELLAWYRGYTAAKTAALDELVKEETLEGADEEADKEEDEAKEDDTTS